MRERAGFTLLEICLAIAIGLLLLGLAVPSVAGLFSEQRLQESFERFDEVVRKAQLLSVSEQRGFVLELGERAVELRPERPQSADQSRQWPQLQLSKEEQLKFERPAAIAKKPSMEWPFWRSGTCEPVVVSYTGPAGHWSVKYDALTVKATWLEKEVR